MADMTDIKIQRGLSSQLFIKSEDSDRLIVNPKLKITPGYWYLTTDTAELFLGVENEDGTKELKQVNKHSSLDQPVQSPSVGTEPDKVLLGAYINEDNGELTLVYSDDTEEEIGKVVGKDGIDGKDGVDGKDGLTTSIKIGEIEYIHEDGVITLPEFITEESLEDKNFVTSDYYTHFNKELKYKVMPVDGMLIDYRDSEIRLNTSRVIPKEQLAGPTAAPNQYYIEFRAYAPENAVYYKEWQGDTRVEEFHTFDESFSGTDEFGRSYSLIWMSIANFANGQWNLYGDKSSLDKYLGFYYTFEWFDKDKKLIDTGKARIILTNDECHNDLVPDAVARRIDDKVSKVKVPTKLSELVNDAGFVTELPENHVTKDDLDTQIAEAKKYTDEKFDAIEIPEVPTKISELFDDTIKFEIMPMEGLIVDYRDSEIRVDASRVKLTQQNGPADNSNYDANKFYIQFRAYAPENADMFKEWLGDTKDETPHSFENNSFAGVDKYGRKYSDTWLAIAYKENNQWKLYGDSATEDKCLGFTYNVEWFDNMPKLITTKTIRIVLTNETTHNNLVSDAVARKIADVKASVTNISNNYVTKEDVANFVTNETLENNYVAINNNNYITKDEASKNIKTEVERVIDENIETIIEEKINKVEIQAEITYGEFDW